MLGLSTYSMVDRSHGYHYGKVLENTHIARAIATGDRLRYKDVGI